MTMKQMDTVPETATYRVQITENESIKLDFSDLKNLLDYFVLLGVSTIYTAPIMQARSGSTHRYDVTDNNNTDIEGLTALKEAMDRLGLRLMVDFVPNHMHAGPENPMWEDLLIWGPESEFNKFFDVNWKAYDGKLLLPILGDHHGHLIDNPITPEEYGLTFDKNESAFYFTHGHHAIRLADALVPDILLGAKNTTLPAPLREALENCRSPSSLQAHEDALETLKRRLADDQTPQHFIEDVTAWHNDGGRYKDAARNRAALYNRVQNPPQHYNLNLHFDDKTGKFLVRYYDNYLTLTPKTYIDILTHRDNETDQTALDLMSNAHALRGLMAVISDPAQTVDNRKKCANDLYAAILDNFKNNDAFSRKIRETLDRYNAAAGRDNFKDLLGKQNYRLSFWKAGTNGINYRRFFDINELIGLCQSNQAVFDYIHKTLFELIEKRLVHGLRIDHIDGLGNPREYLERLRANIEKIFPGKTHGDLAATMRIVVEKILEGGESLRDDWKTEGTTGYEYMNAVSGLAVNPDARETFQDIFRNISGNRHGFASLLLDVKSKTMEFALLSEMNTLSHIAEKIVAADSRGLDHTRGFLHGAIVGIMKHYPVYRTYIEGTHLETGTVPQKDLDIIEQAAGNAAKEADLDKVGIAFIKSILTGQILKDQRKNAKNAHEFLHLVKDFVRRFQQFSGPVMAIAKENTLFYRYHVLSSLCEVGGDPDHFGTSLEEYHQQNAERRKNHPRSMTTIQTHDAKRGPLTRALINATTNDPELWNETVLDWTALNQSMKTLSEAGEIIGPDGIDEYFIYQTLVGAIPVQAAGPDDPLMDQALRRIKDYTLKALREAKRRTTWTDQNGEYENACTTFIDRLFEASPDNKFRESFFAYRKKIEATALLSLTSQYAKLVTSPGIPDIYQGIEQIEHAQSLVDPDNRRKVDFGKSHDLLKTWSENAPELDELLENHTDGCLSFYVLWKALRSRNAAPDLFLDGSYTELYADGQNRNDVAAFMRRKDDRIAVTITPRIVGKKADLIGKKTLSLTRIFNHVANMDAPASTLQTGLTPGTELIEFFSGRVYKVGKNGEINLGEIFSNFPEALLLDPETAKAAAAAQTAADCKAIPVPEPA